MSTLLSILLFLALINNIIGFCIHNITNTTTTTSSSSYSATTTTQKDATISEIIITICGIIAFALFVACCCYVWNKKRLINKIIIYH